MTFDEWFREEFKMHPDDMSLSDPLVDIVRAQAIVARMAWEAAYYTGWNIGREHAAKYSELDFNAERDQEI